jgi:LmbE family N-acetylglucosaminyl deacetylase
MVTSLQWRDRLPVFRSRVLVAAPHPDDEVLGCAGLMVWLIEQGHRVEILAVTDGDASHAQSARITRLELVERRRFERARALSALGLGDVVVERLQFPDAAVGRHEAELSAALRERLDRETTLVVPWRHDGHPDHEAVARAGRRATDAAGADCAEVPIWARVRGRRCRPEHVLDLHDFRARKCAAVDEYRSQLVALGPDAIDGPVVHPHERVAMTSATEWLVTSP